MVRYFNKKVIVKVLLSSFVMYGVASSDSFGPAKNYNGLSLSQGHVGAMS